MAKNAQFYFISEQYYIDFPDDKLMKNKPSDNGIPHQRPFFFAFPDKLNPNIFWMVPVSSQCQKYQSIAQKG